MDNNSHTGVARRERSRRDTTLTLLVLAVPTGVTLWLLLLLPDVRDGAALQFGLPWVPSLGVSLSFLVDGLSLLFALLISGIGIFVVIYASIYLRGHALLSRFYFYLLLFMVGMLGLVLAADLIALFVFWEVTTVASYLLIGFDHASVVARRAALQALLVTALGGLCLLAGLILLGNAAGSYGLGSVLQAGEQIRSGVLYTPMLLLILVGALTKSAQIPFHFWLPSAMAAPTPVSAYLHSATMVKAGIYLIARLHPALAGTALWEWTLTLVGATTAVVGAILALRQTDIKLALAYTTVVALGTLTMFLGSDATVAIAAAITFVLVHAFYKAALFMVVGIINHATGTRELAQLGGLWRSLPISFVAALAAAASMAGFPPFLGFIGKELKYEGALAMASEPLLAAGAVVFANAMMLTVAATVVLKPFLGRPPRETGGHEAVPGLWIGPLLLAGLGLAFGLNTSLIADSLVQPAVTAILGRPEVVELKLWHGMNLALLLSITTLGLGIAVFLAQRQLRALMTRLAAWLPLSADRTWDSAIEYLKAIAAAQTRLLQHGILSQYLMVVFATLALLLVFALSRGDTAPTPDWPQLTIKAWAAMALALAGALLAAAARRPLAAICGLGALGVGLALIYLFFGAPDVAITQLLVETLFLVMIAMTLHRLPLIPPPRRSTLRIGDALLAAAFGCAVTATLLFVLQQPFDPGTQAYFEQAAVPEAHGRNIVNVILVDFRALDTFGEILVVFAATVAAVALLRGRKGEDG
ncbi:hydrogen gas-evolving membrane-bound hydrogenase subunit E [Microbulbifer sp.]|uniref:hydrogen gas-evolving membrane-bound hydrogenase subunit E n=1 Tax=Microbulbifer sp. TaxID=1908541 RepID=UPI003F3710E7